MVLACFRRARVSEAQQITMAFAFADAVLCGAETVETFSIDLSAGPAVLLNWMSDRSSKASLPSADTAPLMNTKGNSRH